MKSIYDLAGCCADRASTCVIGGLHFLCIYDLHNLNLLTQPTADLLNKLVSTDCVSYLNVVGLSWGSLQKEGGHFRIYVIEHCWSALVSVNKSPSPSVIS